VEGSEPPGIPGSLTDLKEPVAAFVTVRALDGTLRGCMGECPARRPLPECVRKVAAHAALDDPRFDPLTPADLPSVRFEISVLSGFRAVEAEEVEVGRHGLFLQSPRGTGLLLPQVPTANGWDRWQFLAALCAKAGVEPGEWDRPDAVLKSFEADVWEET
jgi:AmmeMemoRadiSam system protein A